MKGKSIHLLLAATAATALSAMAQSSKDYAVFWDFESSGFSPATVTPIMPFKISPMSSGAGSLSLGIGGSTSGNTTQQAIATVTETGFNTNGNHIIWTVTPTVPFFDLTVTNISFYTRSTTTGPTAWRLVAHCNGVDVLIADKTGDIPNDSSWLTVGATTNVVLSTSNPITFKLYGYNRVSVNSGSENWRIDNLSITGFVSAPPNFIAPVDGVDVNNLTHKNAILNWDGAFNATGYEIEVCKTNAYVYVNEPRLIITKVFYSGNNRAFEITNIGQVEANLNNYSYKRWRLTGTIDSDWRTAVNFSSLNLANSTTRMLGPGESIFIIHAHTVSGTPYPQDSVLQNAKSLGSNTGELAWSNDNRIGLFLTATDTLVDFVVTQNNNILIRTPGVEAGTTQLIRSPALGSAPSQPQEHPGQWTALTPAYNGTNANLFNLAPHYVYNLVFPIFNSNSTTYNIANLKFRSTYFFRVRGTASGGFTGAWSDFASFLTLEPPPGTIFMVR